MINKLNTTAAEKLFAAAMSRGQYVTAVENTPLGNLVRESIPLPGELTEDLTQSLFAGAAKADPTGAEHHNDMLDDLENTLAPQLKNQLTFVHEVVQPAVAHAYSDVERLVSASTPKNLNLESVYLSAAVNSQAAVNLYEPFKQVVRLDDLIPVAQSDSQPINAELVTGYLKTGVSTFDQDLLEMLAKHSDGWLVDVYDRYFVKAQLPAPNFSLADELLAALVVAMHLVDNPPQDVDQQLVVYRGALSNNIRVIGKALSLAVDQFWKMVYGKRLLLSAPNIPDYTTTDDLTIYVVGPVAELLFADGGTPETVFGLAIAVQKDGTNLDYMLATALDNRDMLDSTYTAWWANAVKVHATHSADIIRNSMEGTLINIINGLPEGKRDPAMTDDTVIEAVRAKVRALTDDAVNNNTYATIQETLCTIAFAHSNALEFLVKLNAYGDKFPDIEPREAAYLAYRDMLVEWALSMIDVSRQQTA